MSRERAKKRIGLDDLPKKVRITLIKVMNQFHIDNLEDALEKIAALADSNSHEYWELVGEQGEMRYKSRHFKEMNRTTATLKKTADAQVKAEYERGWAAAYKNYAILYPCKICQGMITITSDSEAHRAIIRYLQDAGWAHAKCVKG